MALPALSALAKVSRLRVQGPRWAPVLYRDLGVPVERPGAAGGADAAVLFPPSLSSAWAARRAGRRIGVPTDGRGWLLTDPVRPGRHRRDTYAALVEVLGARVEGNPVWSSHANDPTVDLPAGHIGLNPLSASGAVREWPRFRALADALDAPVVFYAGPGEGRRLAAVAGHHRQVVGLPLPALARALESCAVLVSGDSGVAHFARACGVPTVVIFGSTDPDHTGPAGCTPVVGPALACAPCRKQRCRAALECFEIPVSSVLRAIERARA